MLDSMEIGYCGREFGYLRVTTDNIENNRNYRLLDWRKRTVPTNKENSDVTH